MNISVFALFAFTLFLGRPAVSQAQKLDPKETIDAVGLTSTEVQEITKQVEQSAYDTPDDWKKELRVRRVGLGNGPGLIVHGSNLLCGGTGNCQIWVFCKTGHRWVSLFPSDLVALAESFQLGPGVTGGIKDLTILANSGAETGATATYKFDGKFYRRN
jgi:hypothetical protein